MAYTVTNSCGTAVVTYPVTVHDCTALSVKTTNTPSIKIFPDPASSIVTIEWTNLAPGVATLTLTDVTGKRVSHTELTGNGSGSQQINVSGLNECVYMLSVVCGADHFTGKLVISR
jgi:hypothetical protein